MWWDGCCGQEGVVQDRQAYDVIHWTELEETNYRGKTMVKETEFRNTVSFKWEVWLKKKRSKGITIFNEVFCSYMLIKLNLQKSIVAFTFYQVLPSYFSTRKKKWPFSLYVLYHRDLFMQFSKQDHNLLLSNKRTQRTESGKCTT